MKLKFVLAVILIFSFKITLSQDVQKIQSSSSNDMESPKETQNNIGINVLFSDNGFGLGSTFYKTLSGSSSLFGSIAFSGAKDDREFETFDLFGNSYTPNKKNRLFMMMVNFGYQQRLFKDEVSDNLRPFVNFGIAPTAIMYTPFEKSYFSSFGYAKAKYTVGGFAGIGVDYLTSSKSSLSLNVRYSHIQLFGQGIESLSGIEKKQFGGLYFIFSYNFMK